jgi:hypothetical protein
MKITQSLHDWRMNFTDFLQYFFFTVKVKRFNNSFLKRIEKSSKFVMIDGNDHEIIWAIRWGLMQSWLMRKGYRPIVLSRKKLTNRNRYYKLFGCRNFLYIDTFFDQKKLPETILNQIDVIFSACDIKNSLLDYTYNDLPIGKISLSGYARRKKRGDLINFNDDNLKLLHKIFIQNMTYAHYIHEFLYDFPDLYITSESFHDEHGVFYYHMLNNGVDIIRMNISSMDNCVLIQRRVKGHEGIHHNTIMPETFYGLVRSCETDKAEINNFVESNFSDRYSDKWHLCKRNILSASEFTRAEMIKEYNLDPKKKIVTIFSHILYDTLFFFEKELFGSYADWLVDTVGAAIKNPNVNWLVKIHPSNAWREELASDNYEELRLLYNEFGELPKHIKFVLPNTNIHPLSLIKHSDVGITVRGTVGMELPCFGNQVITAASGRYSGLGFTNDPETKSEYLEMLSKVNDLPRLSKEQVRMANIYYYAIFKLKPMPLSDLKPILRMGFSKVGLLGGLYSKPRRNIDLNAMDYQPEISRFLNWIENSKSVDFLGSNKG